MERRIGNEMEKKKKCRKVCIEKERNELEVRERKKRGEEECRKKEETKRKEKGKRQGKQLLQEDRC